MADALLVHDATAPGCTVLSLCGELDIATAPVLRARLSELATLGRFRLIFDLAPLEFMDAYGLRVLLAAATQVHDRGGWVRLIDVRPRTCRVLDILRLTGRLPMYRTLDDALEARQGGTARA